MFKSFKFLTLASVLLFFLGTSVSTAFAAESSEGSLNNLWDQAGQLSDETTIDNKETVNRAVWYDKWGKGTMALTAVDTYALGDIELYAIPVNKVSATGKTVRDDKLGTSAVVTLLMRNAKEVGRKHNSATISKTASAVVNSYPGSVPPKTEFRAHGTHTITKGLKQSLGYTGSSLKF